MNKSQIVPLIKEGKTLQATETVTSTLLQKTRARLDEETKRVGAESFIQAQSIPSTKGTVAELIGALTEGKFVQTKTGAGAKNIFGHTILYHFLHENGTHFRVHHMKKHSGEGEHIGWAHVTLTEGARPEIGKRGTGATSLRSYLEKLKSSQRLKK